MEIKCKEYFTYVSKLKRLNRKDLLAKMYNCSNIKAHELHNPSYFSKSVLIDEVILSTTDLKAY